MLTSFSNPWLTIIEWISKQERHSHWKSLRAVFQMGKMHYFIKFLRMSKKEKTDSVQDLIHY